MAAIRNRPEKTPPRAPWTRAFLRRVRQDALKKPRQSNLSAPAMVSPVKTKGQAGNYCMNPWGMARLEPETIRFCIILINTFLLRRLVLGDSALDRDSMFHILFVIKLTFDRRYLSFVIRLPPGGDIRPSAWNSCPRRWYLFLARGTTGRGRRPAAQRDGVLPHGVIRGRVRPPQRAEIISVHQVFRPSRANSEALTGATPA